MGDDPIKEQENWLQRNIKRFYKNALFGKYSDVKAIYEKQDYEKAYLGLEEQIRAYEVMVGKEPEIIEVTPQFYLYIRAKIETLLNYDTGDMYLYDMKLKISNKLPDNVTYIIRRDN